MSSMPRMSEMRATLNIRQHLIDFGHRTGTLRNTCFSRTLYGSVLIQNIPSIFDSIDKGAEDLTLKLVGNTNEMQEPLVHTINPNSHDVSCRPNPKVQEFSDVHDAMINIWNLRKGTNFNPDFYAVEFQVIPAQHKYTINVVLDDEHYTSLSQDLYEKMVDARLCKNVQIIVQHLESLRDQTLDIVFQVLGYRHDMLKQVLTDKLNECIDEFTNRFVYNLTNTQLLFAELRCKFAEYCDNTVTSIIG